MRHRKGLGVAALLVALSGAAMAADGQRRAAAEANHPPIITSDPPLHASCTDPFEYTVRVRDEGNEPVTFSLVAGPKGMSLDPRSGRVAWRPEWGAQPVTDVVVKATDARGASATQAFQISLSLLYKIGAFGDPTHCVAPLDDEFLCGVTNSRLKTFRRQNVGEAVCSYWDPSRLVRTFECYKGHVYLPHENADIEIFDVTNPEAIRKVGRIETMNGAFTRLERIDDKLLVPDSKDQSIGVFSLEDPARPRELARAVAPRTPEFPDGFPHPSRLVRVDRTLYALSHLGLGIFDIADLNRIRWLGGIPIRARLMLGALIVRPPHAYVFAGHELRVYDVSNPAAIREVTAPQGPGGVHQTYCSHAVLRDKAFIGFGSNGIYQYDLSDPLKPQPASRFTKRISDTFLAGKEQDFAVDAAGKASPIHPGEPLPVLRDPFGITPRNVVVRDGIAYVFADGLKVLDVSKPRRPRLISRLACPTVIRSTVFLDGNLLYSTSAIIDVSNHEAPKLLSRLRGGSGIARGQNGLLFTADEKALTFWNASDPAKATQIGTVELADPISHLFARGDVLYVGFRNATLASYKVGTNLKLAPLGQIALRRTRNGNTMDLRADDRFLYVALNGDGVASIELKDPAKLAVHGWFKTFQFAEQVKGINGFAYVADGSGGVVIVDLIEKGEGRLVASYPTADWGHALDVSGPYVFLCEDQAGLSIFAFDLLTALRGRAVGF